MENQYPKYYIAGGHLPSEYDKNGTISVIFKIAVENKKAKAINHVFIHGANNDYAKLMYSTASYSNEEIEKRFTPTTEQEWEKAVELLINDIHK